MEVNELFQNIIRDQSLQENAGLKEEEIENLTITTKIEDDYIHVLKTIIYGLKNERPNQTIYNSIKQHFGIN